MKNNIEVITDFKDLLVVVNDSKEGYKVSVEATADLFLKNLFQKIVEQRMEYEQELKMHLLMLGEVAENEKGGVLGIIQRTWLEIKDALNSRDEAAILEVLKTEEQAALLKYDFYIEGYAENTLQLELLQKQRSGVLNVLKEIEELYQKHTN